LERQPQVERVAEGRAAGPLAEPAPGGCNGVPGGLISHAVKM